MVATGATDAARADAELATPLPRSRSTRRRPRTDPSSSGTAAASSSPSCASGRNRTTGRGLLELVDDELFDLVAVRGTPDECGRELATRTAGLVDRVATNAPYASDPDIWTDVLKAFRSHVDTMAEGRSQAPEPDGRP